ncbi:urease subunit alpha [Striga asiatica]|uniref:Urease subunit alpha n=1 Tax=Striga asiatica TaxID=4170 RepID=A0A5A7P0E8_STRAF|nr:urease subunit alpha [Striga asiatica]
MEIKNIAVTCIISGEVTRRINSGFCIVKNAKAAHTTKLAENVNWRLDEGIEVHNSDCSSHCDQRPKGWEVGSYSEKQTAMVLRMVSGSLTMCTSSGLRSINSRTREPFMIKSCMVSGLIVELNIWYASKIARIMLGFWVSMSGIGSPNKPLPFPDPFSSVERNEDPRPKPPSGEPPSESTSPVEFVLLTPAWLVAALCDGASEERP